MFLHIGEEVVFQCRDEGNQRAKVRWVLPSGKPLHYGSKDINGRLEIPNVKVNLLTIKFIEHKYKTIFFFNRLNRVVNISVKQ